MCGGGGLVGSMAWPVVRDRGGRIRLLLLHTGTRTRTTACTSLLRRAGRASSRLTALPFPRTEPPPTACRRRPVPRAARVPCGRQAPTCRLYRRRRRRRLVTDPDTAAVPCGSPRHWARRTTAGRARTTRMRRRTRSPGPARLATVGATDLGLSCTGGRGRCSRPIMHPMPTGQACTVRHRGGQRTDTRSVNTAVRALSGCPAAYTTSAGACTAVGAAGGGMWVRAASTREREVEEAAGREVVEVVRGGGGFCGCGRGYVAGWSGTSGGESGVQGWWQERGGRRQVVCCAATVPSGIFACEQRPPSG